MKVLQRYAVWIAITQMKASVLHGIGRRRSLPTSIRVRGTSISGTATWTAIPSTAVIGFVVSQAFNRLGEDFSFFSIKRKVFPYDPI